jgi:hypothetical protein
MEENVNKKLALAIVIVAAFSPLSTFAQDATSTSGLMASPVSTLGKLKDILAKRYGAR